MATIASVSDAPGTVVPFPVGGQTPWDLLYEEFDRALAAIGRSTNTRDSYRETAGFFSRFLAEQGYPLDPAQVKKAWVREWLVSLRERGNKARTVRNRYAALGSFFAWLVKEEEIEHSPMPERPTVPDDERGTLEEDEVRRILATCGGKTFEERRDYAILMLAIDSGLRRRELAGLKVEDLDLASQQGRCLVKGGRIEWFWWGAKTAQAIDRYRRIRARHPDAARPELWLSARRGALTDVGIHQMCVRRWAQAGVTRKLLGGVGPHQLRHYFAHSLKADGASDEVVMRAGRWHDSRSMARYGRGAAVQRAREWHREHSPGDKL